MRARALSWITVAVACVPRVALACPVCFNPKNEESRVAFEISTAFLTLLPLALVAVGVYWAWRRARRLDADQPRPSSAAERERGTALTPASD